MRENESAGIIHILYSEMEKRNNFYDKKKHAEENDAEEEEEDCLPTTDEAPCGW